MSNSTSSARTIDIAGAYAILLSMDKYMLFILYVTGMVGSLLNMITFLQKEIRANSCSTYFLSTSLADFCIMNLFLLMQIITALNKQLSDWIYDTVLWCRLGNYLMFLLPCLSSTYLTLASMDRFCASSLHSKLRKLSQLQASRRLVQLVFLLWAVFALHIPIAFDRRLDPSSNKVRCLAQSNVATVFVGIDGFLFALYNGAFVPLLLGVFGLLICHNMKRSRDRVAPQQNADANRLPTTTSHSTGSSRTVANQQKQHMIMMLLVQVLLTIFLNIPYIVLYLFGYYGQLPRDPLSLLLYIIFSFLARWFYYLNYCKTFYINTLTSQLFRQSLRKQFLSWLRKCRMRVNLTN